MTAYTTFKRGGTVGTPVGQRHRGVQAHQWDIADFVATNAMTSGDSEALFSVPARSILNILAVYNDSTIAIGGTPVFSIGDGGSATRFVNASSNVTTDTHHTIALGTYTYDTADTVKVTLSNSSGSVATGKFTVVYELIDCSALADGSPSF